MDETSVRRQMDEALQFLVRDISSIRTGRASAALVEDILIPAYGGQQTLRIMELASINTPDAQTIVIEPWDKSIIGDIKKGIMESNLGMNPNIDGSIIRLVLPPMTQEDREKYVKLLRTKLENGRIMVRQIRGDVKKEIDKLFENKEITEDEKFRQEKLLQEITDEFTKKIDEVGESKEKELLQV